MKPLPRRVMFVLLLGLVATGAWFLLATDAGAQLRRDPAAFYAPVRDWTAARPILSAAIVLALYVIVTLSMMPVLWLPILAGAAFGLPRGVLLCEVGATLGAICANRGADISAPTADTGPSIIVASSPTNGLGR